MSEMLVWREKMQKMYARHSIYIDKAAQFLFALVAFLMLNKNIGVMDIVASPIVSLGLAVVCTLLPPICSVLAAGGILLLHMYEISLGIMAVSVVVFFIMFAFYCQFTPKRAILLLITPIAYMLHIPYAVAIVCGLLFGPVIAVPVIFGTIVHYMISFLKTSAAAVASAGGITGEITLFIKSVFLNKEMWVACVAAAVCIFVVYAVRRLSIEYAWFIAIAAGTVTNFIMIICGSAVAHVHVAYGSVLVGNVIAALAGVMVQFFVFNVDYSRTETMQFEDDEYYYYVKAVPKVMISTPDKVVKHISEKSDEKGTRRKRESQMRDTEQILLEKSLKEELEIQNIIDRELGEGK